MQLDKSQHYSIQVVCPLPSAWTAAMRKEPGQVCILRRLVTMNVTQPVYL